MRTETVVDARGLKCPLPVLKAEKQLALMTSGATLIVLATDPMAKVDMPLFCAQRGHAWTLADDGEAMRFAIVKG